MKLSPTIVRIFESGYAIWDPPLLETKQSGLNIYSQSSMCIRIVSTLTEKEITLIEVISEDSTGKGWFVSQHDLTKAFAQNVGVPSKQTREGECK